MSSTSEGDQLPPTTPTHTHSNSKEGEREWEPDALHHAIVATEDSTSWFGVNNLDVFFTRIYHYYLENGYLSIITSRITNLITLLFTILFSVFLFIFINWSTVIHCHNSNSSNDDDVNYCTSSLIFRTPNEILNDPSPFDLLIVIYFLLFLLYFFWNFLSFLYLFRDLSDTKNYYNNVLYISDDELINESIKWETIIERILLNEKLGKSRISIVKQLTYLDITNRIMRKENFFIAMINLDLFNFNLPFLHSYCNKGHKVKFQLKNKRILNSNEKNRKCWQRFITFFCCKTGYQYIPDGTNSGPTSRRMSPNRNDEITEMETVRIDQHAHSHGSGGTSTENDYETLEEHRAFQGPSTTRGPSNVKFARLPIVDVNEYNESLHSASPPPELLAPPHEEPPAVSLPLHTSDSTHTDSHTHTTDEDDHHIDDLDSDEEALDTDDQKATDNLAYGSGDFEHIRPIRPPTNCFSRRGVWSYLVFGKALEWNLRFLLFNSLFDNSLFLINKQMKGESGIRTLKRRFFILGLINLLLLPFILLFILVFFILKHAEELHSKKTDFSLRTWTPFALWKMREFNELYHFFDRRMTNGAEQAQLYTAQFPSPLMTLAAQCIAYVSGAIVGIIILLTFSDSSLLTTLTVLDRPLLWHLAVFSLILAISRSLVPSKSNRTFQPALQLTNVLKYTHYLPDRWKGQMHSYNVYREFSWMYRPRLVSFCSEILSVLLTPFILCYSMPKCAHKIIHFIERSTIHIEGIGDICAYAIFDLESFGDEKYAGNGVVKKGKIWSEHNELNITNNEQKADNSEKEKNEKKSSTNNAESKSEKQKDKLPEGLSGYQASASSNTTPRASDSDAHDKSRPAMNTNVNMNGLGVHRCKDGKLEKSLLSFAINHPNWKADHDQQGVGGTRFLSQLSHSIAVPHTNNNDVYGGSSLLLNTAGTHTGLGFAAALNRSLLSVTQRDKDRTAVGGDDEMNEFSPALSSPLQSPPLSRAASDHDDHKLVGVGQLKQRPLHNDRTPDPKHSNNNNTNSNNDHDLSASDAHLVASFSDMLHLDAARSYLANSAIHHLFPTQSPTHAPINTSTNRGNPLTSSTVRLIPFSSPPRESRIPRAPHTTSRQSELMRLDAEERERELNDMALSQLSTHTDIFSMLESRKDLTHTSAIPHVRSTANISGGIERGRFPRKVSTDESDPTASSSTRTSAAAAPSTHANTSSSSSSVRLPGPVSRAQTQPSTAANNTGK